MCIIVIIDQFIIVIIDAGFQVLFFGTSEAGVFAAARLSLANNGKKGVPDYFGVTGMLKKHPCLSLGCYIIIGHIAVDSSLHINKLAGCSRILSLTNQAARYLSSSCWLQPSATRLNY